MGTARRRRLPAPHLLPVGRPGARGPGSAGGYLVAGGHRQVLALRCVLLSSRSFVSQWCHEIATFKAKLKEPLRSLQANEQPSKNIERLVNLRATDVKLMRQLLIINESIESIKWMIEEKAIASRGSSLSGSLCSLLESQDTSLHGSCNSLQDCSDGLDGISVGSYLDTLVDDVPGRQTPSDMDQFSDSSIMEDSQPLHKHPKIDSDEYYCFG
ncbi:Leucine rich adaptor protein 1-like protein [Aix galericulata]|nr:Leucine rich adaptor protein 1-like protein [Aix galericulata]